MDDGRIDGQPLNCIPTTQHRTTTDSDEANETEDA